jgi:hypothetical protein
VGLSQVGDLKSHSFLNPPALCAPYHSQYTAVRSVEAAIHRAVQGLAVEGLASSQFLELADRQRARAEARAAPDKDARRAAAKQQRQQQLKQSGKKGKGGAAIGVKPRGGEQPFAAPGGGGNIGGGGLHAPSQAAGRNEAVRPSTPPRFARTRLQTSH